MKSKKIISAVINRTRRFISLLPGGWYLLTLSDLRFKFSALRAGIRKNGSSEGGSLFNFRRSIHRIEKGLIYKNRKDVFAEDYIGTTVTLYLKGRKGNQFDENTLKWGESVLNKYFESVKKTEVVQKAYAAYSGEEPMFKEPDWCPYDSSERRKSNITYEQLLDLSYRRRSIRFFRKQAVEHEVVERAVRIAAQSPSACNRQPFTYLFFNDPEIAKRISKIPGGVSGYELYNVIVVLGDYSAYFNVRDVNAPIIDASLANMSLLYALEVLGVGTVCINWPNLPDRENKIREVLDIEDSEFVIMLIGLGYPTDTGGVPFSGKRSQNNLLQINNRIKI